MFNQKVVAALRINGFHETARYCELVLCMWSCLNIKNPETWYRLNGRDKMPFTDKNDNRLQFLKDMATMFKTMDTYYPYTKARVKGLTTDTSKYHCYSLNKNAGAGAGEFQSDRLEGEFFKDNSLEMAPNCIQCCITGFVGTLRT